MASKQVTEERARVQGAEERLEKAGADSATVIDAFQNRLTEAEARIDRTNDVLSHPRTRQPTAPPYACD